MHICSCTHAHTHALTVASTLAEKRETIDRCFGSGVASVEDILERYGVWVCVSVAGIDV